MSNYFLEQLRIRKAIAREEWEEYRDALPFAIDTESDDFEVSASSITFGEFWAIEFDRWMVNSARNCMNALGTFQVLLRPMN